MDTINYSKGFYKYNPIERKNDMSFNCIYINDNQIILGSDSRESFLDGTYNDNRQKIFANRDLEIIWSMTGIIKYRGVDYTHIVNEIMNIESLLIDKIHLIQHILTYPTYHIYSQEKKDSIFDLVIGQYENNHLQIYIIEVKNGQCLDKDNQTYTFIEAPICSGVHTNLWKYLNLNIMDNSDSITDVIGEMNRFIHQIIDYDKDKTNTVGGDSYITLIDNAGHIKTYINGIEKEF